MVKVKTTLKKAMPRTVYFHFLIRIKNTLDVQNLRMERVNIVQQRWTQKAIWLIGLAATNFANMTVTVSFIFYTISKIRFVYTTLVIINS